MKKKKNQKKEIKNIDNETLKLGMVGKVVIVLVVLGSFFAFYLLTSYIVHKDSNTANDNLNESNEAVISYDKILLGRSFSMGDADYYVIYYDSSDEDIFSVYNDLVSSYRAKEDGLPIYYVDMKDGINKNYSTTEESNKNPTSVNDLAINGPTLIRIQDGKVTGYTEGEEDIKAALS